MRVEEAAEHAPKMPKANHPDTDIIPTIVRIDMTTRTVAWEGYLGEGGGDEMRFRSSPPGTIKLVLSP